MKPASILLFLLSICCFLTQISAQVDSSSVVGILDIDDSDVYYPE